MIGKDEIWYKKIAEIYDGIRNQDDHPLFRFCAMEYYRDFWELVQHLYSEKALSTVGEIKRFKRQLELNGNFDCARYLQGVPEIIFQYFAMRKQLEFHLEKNVNNKNGKDVDIQLRDGDFTYNVEIKTPQYLVESNEEDVIKANTSYRVMEKEKLDTEKAHLHDMLEPALKSKDNKFTKIQYSKIEDNKLLSFLRDAQEKFSVSDENSINILALSVTSDKMQDYWNYLYNGYSGVFTPCYNSDLIHIKKEEFDRIDVILLSNLISGHVHPVDGHNSWHLESYCNILCRNANSQRAHVNQSMHNRYQIVYIKAMELFPNSTNGFEELYKKYDSNFPDEFKTCIFSELLSSYYAWLWWNH